MKIYAFGDSHAGKFGADDRFILGGTGASTAHNLCLEGSKTGSLGTLRYHLHFYDTEDIFLFVLGEIDCRLHFYRISIETGTSISELIQETVKRYGRIIKAVRDANRPNVAVLDVPPAVAQGNVYGYEHYGSRDERAEIAWLFNLELESFCTENEICFVRLYPYIADDRGWLKEKYALEDEAHISSEVVPFVVTELRKCFPEL